ncbi:hypothetical protein BD779DRAFT_1508858, partial [Infundibulicybe gibba]
MGCWSFSLVNSYARTFRDWPWPLFYFCPTASSQPTPRPGTRDRRSPPASPPHTAPSYPLCRGRARHLRVRFPPTPDSRPYSHGPVHPTAPGASPRTPHWALLHSGEPQPLEVRAEGSAGGRRGVQRAD